MRAGETDMRRIRIKRIYEPTSRVDGFRVLVDRVWPRGISKEAAAIDYWAKEIAPSAELRKWFGHDPEKWIEFQKRYRTELSRRATEFDSLFENCRNRTITLLFGARDKDHNQAVVLRDVLMEWQRSTQ